MFQKFFVMGKLLFAVCFLFVFVSSPVGASEKKKAVSSVAEKEKGLRGTIMGDIDPMPDVSFMSQKAFEEKTEVYEEIPFEVEELAFQINLPKGWKETAFNSLVGIELDKNLMSDIAKYHGPPIKYYRPSVIVQAMEFEHGISAKHWFLNYAMMNGFSLKGMDVLPNNSVRAIYASVKEGTTYVVRARVETNGGQLFFVRYIIPIEAYKDMETLQAQIVESFQAKAPENEFAEKMDHFNFLGFARFSYPRSWVLRAERRFRNPEFMEASIRTSEDWGYMDGRIDIRLFSWKKNVDMNEEVKKVQKEILRNKGLVQGDIGNMTYNTFRKFTFQSTTIKKVKFEDTYLHHEFWIGVLYGPKYAYLITMLSPARDQEYMVWARNSETFRLVMENFK